MHVRPVLSSTKRWSLAGGAETVGLWQLHPDQFSCAPSPWYILQAMTTTAKDPEVSSTTAPLAVGTEAPGDVTRLLAECCERRLPVKLVMLTTTCKARFLVVEDRSVTLELLHLAQIHVKKGAICCASFVHGGRICIFLSSVQRTSIHSAERLATITLTIPSQIEGPERREGLRVPVCKEDGLEAQLLSEDGRAWQPAALDLSLTGGLVELPPEVSLAEATGTRLVLSLRLGDIAIQLTAEVRRRQGQRYGLLFHHAKADEGPPSLDGLLKIVKRLEENWFHRQRRSWAMIFGRHPIPSVKTHEDARCLHCGTILEDAHGTTNPAGFGQFVGICRSCELYTWYDLDVA